MRGTLSPCQVEMETTPKTELPVDVLPFIFEYVAYQDRRYAARTLSLVNKSVKQWVEKITYAVVVLRTGTQVHLLSRTLRSHPHLAPLIRALALPDKWKTHLPSIQYLLSTCNLYALYWNAYDDIHPDRSPAIRRSLESLPLKILYSRLLTFIDWGDPADTPLAFDKGLTHLGVMDNWIIFRSMLVASEERVMAPGRWEMLTHLSVQVMSRAPFLAQMSMERSLYEKVLGKTERLKACVAYVERVEGEEEGRARFRRGLSAEGEVVDEQVVVIERRLGVEEWLGVVEEWERSDECVAEWVVDKRRRERERKEKEKESD
ncbi:hypothetical protein BDQ17DRAFT_260474 [Cyathus striatus]|nr:hypothetical protein BDQ17DRAFT_260474 [Cyathus striatus]